jgi:spermidine synthase
MLARLRFYWVVTVCGGVLMALEILSSRILAPHFGNSVYVWGSIISVFLAALSLGYLLGGRLADRQPSIAALGRILALAAACLGALQLAYAPLAARMGALTGGAPTGTLLAAAVLFGPASTLLATVSPWAVRLAARDLGHLGHTAGRLFALSTLGSLGGTLAATFFLIPFLELSRILGLLTLLTAASAGIALVGQLRAERLAAALSLLLLVSALPAAFLGGKLGGELIYERVTPYQTLQVRESRGVRRLESDRVTQATVRLADRQTTMPYVRMIPAALLLKPELRSALMIGLGGGSAGRYLAARIPDLDVEYVEIDPAVAEVARRFFFFDTGPRLRLTIEDGRGYLRRSARTWDLIYGDAYIGQSVPFHLTTAQFLDEVKRHLAPGGIFGLNLAAGLSDPFSQAIYRTVRDRFDTVYVFAVRGARNVLIVATPEAMTLSPGDLVARARELDRRLRFDPPLATVATWRTEVSLDMNRVQILSDEFAPVDRLIRLGERMRSVGEQLKH